MMNFDKILIFVVGLGSNQIFTTFRMGFASKIITAQCRHSYGNENTTYTERSLQLGQFNDFKYLC